MCADPARGRMQAMIRRVLIGLAALCVMAVAVEARAQSFGRNKVQYRTFDFQVLRTEHFDIYYYPEEADAAQLVGRLSERWRSRLGRFFEHELRGRQAIILYAAPAHFRQTNAVAGVLGGRTAIVRTGGTTQPARLRQRRARGVLLAEARRCARTCRGQVAHGEAGPLADDLRGGGGFTRGVRARGGSGA